MENEYWNDAERVKTAVKEQEMREVQAQMPVTKINAIKVSNGLPRTLLPQTSKT